MGDKCTLHKDKMHARFAANTQSVFKESEEI